MSMELNTKKTNTTETTAPKRNAEESTHPLYQNFFHLIRLQFHRNYWVLWVCLALSLAFSLAEVLSVLIWSPARHFNNYAITTGQSSPFFLFILPVLLIWNSHNILTNSRISMFPGTTLTRFCSRVITDCLMLFVIPLTICLENILQYVILSLCNAFEITHAVLPFSWSYLAYYLITYTLVFITIYSLCILLWILLTRLSPALSIGLAAGTLLAIFISLIQLELTGKVLEAVLLFFEPNYDGMMGTLPSLTFVVRNLSVTLLLLVCSTLLTLYYKTWTEHPRQTAIARFWGILLLFYCCNLFYMVSFDFTTYSGYGNAILPPYYVLSPVQKTFSVQADSEQWQKILCKENIETLPAVEASEALDNSDANPYCSAEDLKMNLKYTSPSHPLDLPEDVLKEMDIPDYPNENDTVTIQVYAPDVYINGYGYVFQNVLEQMDITLQNNTLLVSLPTTPIVLNEPFGSMYYTARTGWNQLVDWQNSSNTNLFESMVFVVQGSDAVIEDFIDDED